MDSIIIEGGAPLHGDIYISGSKNASLPIMAASILCDGEQSLSNIPILSDIETMVTLLRAHGANIDVKQIKSGTHNSLNITICTRDINNLKASYDIVRKMRASIWVLAPLLAKHHEAIVSLPGGCAIGARQVDLHIAVLKAMGAEIKVESGYIHAKTPGQLNGCNFTFSKISVGATITGILAATLAKGVTILNNCAQEPEIVDLCNFLVKSGAKIENIGTKQITITGARRLLGCQYQIMPDRIETGTYMIAAAITNGDIKIHGTNYDIIANLSKLMQKTGVHISHSGSKNNNDVIHVKNNGIVKAVDMSTEPYPGIATDLQAQFMTFMTIANGVSNITENIFENRFMHVPELARMGADITIDHNTARVRGVDRLLGAEVMASDLRASVSLVLAGLVAKGQTKVRRIYHLDRGYQDLVTKLSECGADIRRVSGDMV